MTASLFPRKLLSHEAMLAVLLALALVTLSQLSDNFLSTDNLLNQMRLMAEIGLITLAMTLVIVTGGIDLSVGSIAGLSAILLGVLWSKLGIPLPLAAVLAILGGLVAGLANGLIITRFGVPPLIATLATLAFYRGLADAGALEGMTEQDMLTAVSAQEAQIRQDNIDWLYPYLFTAYQPLTDAELESYITFSESLAGRRANAALFAAFDAMFVAVSNDLGRAAGRLMAGDNI